MLKLIKALVESADLAIYSYVKPGAPHRYSMKFRDLHSFVRVVTSALDTYSRAVDIGEGIAKGRMGFTDSNVGSLIRKAIQESTHALEEALLPEYHVIMIPAMISASYTVKLKGAMTVDYYRKGVKSLLMFSKVEDTIALYEALRSCRGEAGRAIGLVGITPGKIRTERMTVLDLLSEIGKHQKFLQFYVKKHGEITELALRFVKQYLDIGDYNLASAQTYARLLESLAGVRVNPEIKGKDDFMKLLKLDNDMHRKGMNMLLSLPLLNEALFVGLLTMEFPKS